MYEDKTLVCKECGKEFVFTAGEQEFYAARGFQNEPQRCKACRDARKNAARGPREFFTATCAACGGEAREVEGGFGDEEPGRDGHEERERKKENGGGAVESKRCHVGCLSGDGCRRTDRSRMSSFCRRLLQDLARSLSLWNMLKPLWTFSLCLVRRPGASVRLMQKDPRECGSFGLEFGQSSPDPL